MATSVEVPLALTIAGSDSSAGAGAQADLKTFSAFGVYGVNAITCVVAETPAKVARIEALSPAAVREQITVLFAAFSIRAAKTGLLHSAEIVSSVSDALRRQNAESGRALPLVIDPVMVATSGDLLLQRDAIAIYERDLFPLATLLTPNLDEAAALLGERISDIEQMRQAGGRLQRKYGVPILLKGGHLAGETATDLLFLEGRVLEFSEPFTRGVTTHGTGCTYSAAITAALAGGSGVEEAVGRAKRFVTRTIRHHFTWPAASGGFVHALNHAAGESRD